MSESECTPRVFPMRQCRKGAVFPHSKLLILLVTKVCKGKKNESTKEGLFVLSPLKGGTGSHKSTLERRRK